MKARDLPVGSIVATDREVWIKQENSQPALSPFYVYETWWMPAQSYPVPMDDRYVDTMIGRGAKVLREGVPD